MSNVTFFEDGNSDLAQRENRKVFQPRGLIALNEFD